MTRQHEFECDNCKLKMDNYSKENICKICGVLYCEICRKYDYMDNMCGYCRDDVECKKRRTRDKCYCFSS